MLGVAPAPSAARAWSGDGRLSFKVLLDDDDDEDTCAAAAAEEETASATAPVLLADEVLATAVTAHRSLLDCKKEAQSCTSLLQLALARAFLLCPPLVCSEIPSDQRRSCARSSSICMWFVGAVLCYRLGHTGVGGGRHGRQRSKVMKRRRSAEQRRTRTRTTMQVRRMQRHARPSCDVGERYGEACP